MDVWYVLDQPVRTLEERSPHSQKAGGSHCSRKKALKRKLLVHIGDAKHPQHGRYKVQEFMELTKTQRNELRSKEEWEEEAFLRSMKEA